MNLRKLPPSILLALGLACGDDEGSSDTVVDTCLSPATTNDGTLSACLDIGPCLSTTGLPTNTSTGMADSSSGAEVSTGPCLSPPETTGTDTGSESSSGTETGVDTGTSTGADMMGDQVTSRSAAVERVLERGALPPDVAERLRRRLDE